MRSVTEGGICSASRRAPLRSAPLLPPTLNSHPPPATPRRASEHCGHPLSPVAGPIRASRRRAACALSARHGSADGGSSRAARTSPRGVGRGGRRGGWGRGQVTTLYVSVAGWLLFPVTCGSTAGGGDTVSTWMHGPGAPCRPWATPEARAPR